MKIYKRLASLAVASAVAISAMAQNSNSSYFMESMANRHEINPAFTPDYNYVSPLPALGGMLIGSNSNIGVSDFLFKHNGQLVTGLNQAISADEFLSGLKNGANLDLNMKLNSLSFGFKKWGGYNTFGLSVHSRAAQPPSTTFTASAYRPTTMWNLPSATPARLPTACARVPR